MNKAYPMPPGSVIKEAVKGDIEYLNEIVDTYQAYIIKLSGRIVRDELGNPHYYVDPEIKTELENRLIMKVLDFQLN